MGGREEPSPSKGLIRSSGKYTLYPKEAKVSATLRCLPLVAPNMSEMMIKTLSPEPVW